MVQIPIVWNDKKTALIVVYPNQWSVDEGLEVLDRLIPMLDEADRRIPLIFDVSHTTIPREVPVHFRRILNAKLFGHPNLRAVLGIYGGEERALDVTVVVNVFADLFGIFNRRDFRMFTTLEAAEQYIDEHLKA